MASGKKHPKGRPAQLRTSREVYDRLRWDPSFGLGACTVGYEERFAGMREAPLQKFAAEGDIPWHRVWYIRIGDLWIWDRKQRIDLLFGSGITPTPQHADIQRAIAEQLAPVASVPTQPSRRSVSTSLPATPQPCYRYDPGASTWVPATAGSARPVKDALTLVTYNLLFDLYEPEKLATEIRVSAILSHLREADADLMALVEVTPTILEQLLADPWIRERYFISDLPEGPSLRPYGQVLMARAPMQVHFHGLSGHKRLVAATLHLAGLELCVVAIHLSSNRVEHPHAIRAAEFEQVCTWLDEQIVDTDATLVLGDFNVDTGELDAAFTRAGFVDLWPAVYPDDPGHTFHPDHNALAAFSSRTQRPRRLDRCLLRSASAQLTPIDVALIGTQPLPEVVPGAVTPLYPSDHYGLWGLVQVQSKSTDLDLSRIAPVHHTAVVVCPPRDHWPAIQAVRKRHDRHAARWMPHITLLYPFLPPEHLRAASATLTEILSASTAFSLDLSKVGHFNHGKSHTGFLAPDDETQLCALQARLVAAFPACDPTPHHGPFVPHLTLGQFPAFSGPIASLCRQAVDPRAFEVTHLAVIVRGENTPFRVVKRIPLGRQSPATVHHSQLLADLEQVCTDIILGGVKPTEVRLCHPVGSVRLGVANDLSDLDTVVTGPAWQNADDLFRRLPDALEGLGHRVQIRSRAPQALRMTMHLQTSSNPVEVDLQYARWPSGTPLCPPSQLTASQRDAMDPSDRRALAAIFDADTILSTAGACVSQPVFLAALMWIRCWARARGIYGNSRTFPGGIAWALLLQSTLPQTDAPPTHPTAAECVANCLRALLARNLETVGTPPAAATPSRATIHVWTPTAPQVNSTRNSTASTKARLLRELERGVQLANANDPLWLEHLCDTVDPREEHRYLLAVKQPATGDRGILDHRFVGLILELEKHVGASFMPYTEALYESTDARYWFIGLASDVSRETRAELALRLKAWEDSVPGEAGLEVVGPSPARSFEHLRSVLLDRPSDRDICP